MVDNPFPYPGGKAYLADWITDYIPRHEAYVEPFAGSAAVLVGKPESKTEVINDADGDVTQFFLTLRDRRGELVEWLRDTPYSRDLHRKYARQFYAGYRPEDDVERAGRFFFLRYTQFASKYRTKSGFSSAAQRNQALKFRNATEKLEAFADRLRDVQIENRDYSAMFERFDGDGVLFYCDPPYLEPGDSLYSHQEPFDHSRFAELLKDLEADWIVSYERVPDCLEFEHCVRKDRSQFMSKAHDDAKDSGTERLLMNFDPSERPVFRNSQQATLGETA